MAVLLGGVVSCQSEQSARQLQRQADSLALKVAVMPTIDCLPLYYAEQNGLFAGEGVDVRLHSYLAQMDCDTAFARGHVEMAYTDLFRAAVLQAQGTGLRVIAGMPGQDALLTARSKRIRTVKQLEERMVGMARNCTSDYLTDRIQDSASLGDMDLYRPQINDIVLRTDMLCNATLDAAFLPEPYASRAICEGNRVLVKGTTWQLPSNVLMLTDKAVTDNNRSDQVKRFMRACEQATREMREGNRADSIRALLIRHYRINPYMADTLNVTVPEKTFTTPENRVTDTVLVWINRRNLVPEGYRTDSLIDTRFISH